eukprot:CAMPEP_0177284866 /NCGR_PEP_ID=MMETSP0367-20130122/72758_1 /TAXON_ID=447022 ORGANISM="Scrippsiella hangoei-like, Strain SHHI-4" /NCGR_SAMPLE_ID=MMETSP0367 /ASSEMBLY_ACC=CAM_ASM_000362 /LENGTH=58 /DNA_ID=CAMNT_0018741955 /DNA_START=18 /DNA_END=194 /DNA_ORIENTATION=-
MDTTPNRQPELNEATDSIETTPSRSPELNEVADSNMECNCRNAAHTRTEQRWTNLSRI